MQIGITSPAVRVWSIDIDDVWDTVAAGDAVFVIRRSELPRGELIPVAGVSIRGP